MSTLAHGANQIRVQQGRRIPAWAQLNDVQHVNHRVEFFFKCLRITQCFQRADREINRHEHPLAIRAVRPEADDICIL